jgi:hypothetical protein
MSSHRSPFLPPPSDRKPIPMLIIAGRSAVAPQTAIVM